MKDALRDTDLGPEISEQRKHHVHSVYHKKKRQISEDSASNFHQSKTLPLAAKKKFHY